MTLKLSQTAVVALALGFSTASGFAENRAASCSGADAPAAPAKTVDQIYFEAVVTKSGTVVGKPHMLARLGADGEIKFYGQPDPDGEGPLGLKFRSTGRHAAPMTVSITAVVDDKEVATRSVEITKAQGADIAFAAGGYVWSVRVDYFSEEFLKARRKAKNA
jgi:hypothetical protein